MEEFVNSAWWQIKARKLWDLWHEWARCSAPWLSSVSLILTTWMASIMYEQWTSTVLCCGSKTDRFLTKQYNGGAFSQLSAETDYTPFGIPALLYLQLSSCQLAPSVMSTILWSAYLSSSQDQASWSLCGWCNDVQWSRFHELSNQNFWHLIDKRCHCLLFNTLLGMA